MTYFGVRQHLHFQEYADYRLWTEAGYQNWVAARRLDIPSNAEPNKSFLDDARSRGDLVVGRKQGFCVIDVAPYHFGRTEPGPPVYQSCSSNQGIKVGWADQYFPQLSCQFIQMTNVAEGV